LRILRAITGLTTGFADASCPHDSGEVHPLRGHRLGV
jgi:hypothetical protein